MYARCVCVWRARFLLPWSLSVRTLLSLPLFLSLIPSASIIHTLIRSRSRSWDGSASVRLCAKKRPTSSFQAMTDPSRNFRSTLARPYEGNADKVHVHGWLVSTESTKSRSLRPARSAARSLARYRAIRIFHENISIRERRGRPRVS